MKKTCALLFCILVTAQAFSQSGGDIGFGFQYGTARVSGTTEREIKEPGALLVFRSTSEPGGGMGFFGRIGAIFPAGVTEGNATFTYDNYDYILFINGGLGVGLKIPLGTRLAFFIDAGLSINDLLYGGSYRDNITTNWKEKFGNYGYTYTATATFYNVKISESYNDVGIGVLGNIALRFNFSRQAFLELGAAVGFDAIRFKSYKFAADFSGYSYQDWDFIKNAFSGAEFDDDSRQIIFERELKVNAFRQFTFIPSIIVGFSF